MRFCCITHSLHCTAIYLSIYTNQIRVPEEEAPWAHEKMSQGDVRIPLCDMGAADLWPAGLQKPIVTCLSEFTLCIIQLLRWFIVCLFELWSSANSLELLQPSESS